MRALLVVAVADAAVGELPGEGLRVAHHPRRGRDPELGARPVRAHGPGFGNVATWLVFSYLWLPYMILPIYAGLERIPNSLLDASGDLGGRPGMTFRRVVLPLALPAVVAGSIFTFSLTLGDYITPQLVSSTQFIGNVVYTNVGIANNLPLAAAFATVPVRDHDRLPADRPAARARSSRSDAPLAPRTRSLLRIGTGDHAGVPLRAAARDRALRVQRAAHADVADRRASRSSGSTRRSTTRACATRCWTSVKAGLGRDADRAAARHAGRARRRRATASSGARRSRSSSSCRSRCPASSPAWRSTRRSARCSSRSASGSGCSR